MNSRVRLMRGGTTCGYSRIAQHYRSTPDNAMILQDAPFTADIHLDEQGSSDHLPLVLDLNGIGMEHTKHSQPKWRLEKADWELFSTLVEHHLSSHDLTSLSPIQQWEAYHNSLIKAARQAIPFRKQRRSGKAWWSQDLTELQKKMHTQHTQLLAEPKNATISSTYAELRREFKATGHAVQAYFPCHASDGTYSSPNQRANAFLKHFAVKSTPSKEEAYADRLPLTRYRQKLTALRRSNEDPIPPFTIAEVQLALHKGKFKKAAGDDTSIATRVPLSCRVLPAAWKKVVWRPLVKPGKPGDEPSHYRPISLLAVGMKLFERLLEQRLEPY
eukprot:3717838-Amphidinium_carterae.3